MGGLVNTGTPSIRVTFDDDDREWPWKVGDAIEAQLFLANLRDQIRPASSHIGL